MILLKAFIPNSYLTKMKMHITALLSFVFHRAHILMDKCVSYKNRIMGMLNAQANITIHRLPAVGSWNQTQFQSVYDSIVTNYTKYYTFETCDMNKFLKEVSSFR